MIIDRNIILKMTTTQIAKIIKNGDISCYQIVKIFISQIKNYNYYLNAMAYNCFNDALNIAKYYDKKYKICKKNGKIDELPKYFGVPIVIKESFEITDKPHTFGFLHRKYIKGKKINPLCGKLIKQGMIIIAAGNLAEGCSWIESVNKIYGTTNNPYDIKRTAGGSSGGTAVLVTICGSPIGLCNDALGSIRIPAYYNCLFGHKTTSGCIKGSYSEIEGMSFSDNFAQGGIVSRKSCELWPFTRILLDNNDISKKVISQKKKYDKLELNKITFIYIGNSFKNKLNNKVNIDSVVNKSILNFLDSVKKKGAKVIEKNYNELEYATFLIVNQIQKNESDNDDIILNSKSIWSNFRDLTLTNFGISLTRRFFSDSDNNPDNLADELLLILKEKMIEDLKENCVFISPTLPIVAPYHNTSIKLLFDIPMVGIFNILGFPVTQVPIGLNYQDIPLGFQIIGNLHQDGLTIKTAELLEDNNICKWVSSKNINI